MRCPNGQSLKICQQFAATKTNECLEWPYSRNHLGYGRTWDQTRVRWAHNLVCEIAHGPAPVGKPHAAHKCGNPSCCNPDHVYWASPHENISSDRQDHGRTARGEKAGLSKLTDDQVREIMRLYVEEGLSQTMLGFEFGVAQTTISEIVSGNTWNHITGLPKPTTAPKPRKRKREINEDDVRDIRRRYEAGETQASIAESYGMWPGPIGKICRRQAWAHVE